MTKFAAAFFLIAATAGFLAPDPATHRITMGGYRVLAGDFHLHMFPLDAATLSPWDVVRQARRRQLDVIALTGHNQTWTAHVGRWFARRVGCPLVLTGEDIITPAYDMVAGPEYAAELREFYQRKPLTAISSSDFHGNSHPGFSRTWVFVQETTEHAVLQALRDRKTVVVGPTGKTYGNPELVRLVEANGGLPRSGIPEENVGWQALSRMAAIAAMLALTFLKQRSND